MWIETITNSKGTRYKYCERYTTITGITKKVTVILNANNAHVRKQATRLLQDKIETIQNKAKEDRKAYFHVWAQKWLDHKALTSKPMTNFNRELHVKKVLAHIGDNELLHDIPPVILEDIVNTFYYVDNLSYHYCKAILQSIKGIYRYAKRNRIISDISDIEYIKLVRKPHSHEDIKKKRDKFLDNDELQEVLSQIKSMHMRIGLAMEFMSRTGLRIGELLALRVQDYDKDNKLININGTIVQSISKKCDAVRGTPKNVYSVRDVSLDDRSIAILDQFILHNKKSTLWTTGYKDKGYIFTTDRGNPYDLHYIAKYLRQVSVNGKHISTHVFRHTHISILAELGIPVKAIMQRVGHNDPNTTLSIYTHVTNKMKDDVIHKLNSYSV